MKELSTKIDCHYLEQNVTFWVGVQKGLKSYKYYLNGPKNIVEI